LRLLVDCGPDTTEVNVVIDSEVAEADGRVTKPDEELVASETDKVVTS